ncbi:hypothetical protein J2127_000552 [Methanococcus voltae]|uniref:hypothetical protein n=1 Tax=Methanococcus voltae TaxID=2188 RepID=UPI001AE34E1D|nr:hypothetical protein [Methanococcus voltae]MBP2143397.1 hypothetical protein [Methanococcus voltae]
MGYPNNKYNNYRGGGGSYKPKVNSSSFRFLAYVVGCGIALGTVFSDFLSVIPAGLGTIVGTLIEGVGYFGVVVCGFILFATAKRKTFTDMLSLAWLLVFIIPSLLTKVMAFILSFVAPAVGSGSVDVIVGGVICLITLLALSTLYNEFG